MATIKPLNQRKHDRYFIDEIPVEGIGSIVEVSRKGLKIKKTPGFEAKTPTLSFKLSTLEIKANVSWEDKGFIGLQLAGAFNDPGFIIKRIKKPKEAVVPPQISVPDKAIQQYKRDEILSEMVNLLMEADSPEPNFGKIGIYIEKISSLQEEESKAREEKRAEEEKKAAEEGRLDEKTIKANKENQRSLKDELLSRAVRSDDSGVTCSLNINYAVTRLGLDNLRQILRNYVHKRIFKSENSLSVFQDVEIYNILKSAVFKNLCRMFGFSDIQHEGNALLSCGAGWSRYPDQRKQRHTGQLL